MKLTMAFIITVFMTVGLLAAPSYADNYHIQAGDIIRISLPGEESLDTEFEVDRQGNVVLPEVGALTIGGLTEANMQKEMKNALSAAFQSLNAMRAYVHKRRMRINVLGYVNAPGEVVVAAGSSVQAVINAAGGLRAGAQLDRMQLRRNGQPQMFDYKHYLDQGDPALLPTLQSLDTVFVTASPKIGNVELEFDPAKMADAGDASDAQAAIKVFGEVNSPGSFTYVEGTSVVDLLMRAGGVTRYAGVERIRIISEGEPRLFDLKAYLDTGNTNLLPSIKIGATIFVPMQEEAVKSSASTVYIMGEVFRPGAYEAANDVTFMDILANAGGPTRYAESRQIRVLKLDGEIIRFDLAAYTEGTLKTIPKIEAGDAIFIPEKTDMNEKSWLKIAPDRAVRVIGEVVRPGRVEWSNEMSLLDLLAHVGGPVSRADTSNIELLIPDELGKTTTVTFNLDRFIREGKPDSELPKLRAGTTIRVHDLPQDPSDNKSQWVRQAADKSIYIFGEVGAPGRYMFTQDLGFLDILSAADGPTTAADLHKVRITHRNKKYAEVTRLDLALYFETGDETLLPDIQPGDSIYIPARDGDWIDQPKEETVRILGEIHSPGRYQFNDAMTVLDLLAEAGGPTSNGLVTKILIVNPSCCKNKARRFDLLKFSKSGRLDHLPVLRAGDTIYIPNKEDGSGAKTRLILGDIFKVVSLGILFGL